VSPHFDAPWRSQSLADFWAKRWDLAAGNTLRDLVYEPVQQGEVIATCCC
jgi:D-alanyl-lipoteichoic acid acyltransferase DltB (MBOAT superfamily)